MEIIANRALLLPRTEDPSLITETIRKSAETDEGVVVHWGLDEAEKLVKLGFTDTPSPILRQYQWTGKFEPFAHQKTTASFLSLRHRAFCFNEQGTGKTASVIWAADYLMKLGKVKRVLVLCPLSIMRSAWQEDLFKFAMHRSCSVAHGTSAQRAKIIKAGAEFVVVNYDGVGVVRDELIAGGFDLIVIDEANAYKNAQTARWVALNKIIKATNPRVWMLTGTPAAQSPVDAYGLAKMLDVPNCPKYFASFRASTMQLVTRFRWAPRPEATEIVHRVLQPAIRFAKKDCLDLPDITHVDRDAPLTPQQKKYYTRLKLELLIESDGEEVSAVNAAAKLNKLLQISCGAVYTDNGEVLEFDVANRMNVVLEVIREASHKVLVFVPFTHTIELLRDRLEKEGISAAVINGEVSMNKRSDTFQRFQEQQDPHVLIIQPQAASHGVTLTAADTIIWYSPVTSVETYLQANARIDRAGQRNPMTIVHIQGSDVERHVYAMLRGSIGHHKNLVELYREVLDKE